MLQRRSQAFRPGTKSNHKAQFELYVSFCLYINVEYMNPSAETICMYIEYLAQNFVSTQSIANYVSGVRLLHKMAGIPAPNLDSFEVKLMMRACILTIRHRPLQRQPLSIDMLSELVQVVEHCGIYGLVFKVAVLFAFYGFLRQSNLAPKSPSNFDPSRHTCRQDIFVAKPGLVVLLKWSKTAQSAQTHELIPLPAIPGSHLCPVTAYEKMVQQIPTQYPNQPLLVLPQDPVSHHTYTPVTVSWLSRFMSTTLDTLGYDAKLFSLHSLRRSGATAAYKLGVDYMNIKRHGLWSSDSFWAYITSDSVSNSPVASALRQLAHHTK